MDDWWAQGTQGAVIVTNNLNFNRFQWIYRLVDLGNNEARPTPGSADSEADTPTWPAVGTHGMRSALRRFAGEGFLLPRLVYSLAWFVVATCCSAIILVPPSGTESVHGTAHRTGI
ncbi:hypothetical protein KGM_213183 [Danaus plexippus plexippus]|uniref:Uncharacterized protein n=1 Tax=Danaus plexippus plexippus TaxID=278856 RepID=A0A212FAW6_DANPL|nr:hypothetical protein KGM_213183 [Danaus plexippus plexippus]